jgi:hypothetical protein
MRRGSFRLLSLLGLAAACASSGPASRAGASGSDPGTIELAWSVCPYAETANGRVLDVDDGGVVVALVVRGARPERVVLGRFPENCEIGGSPPGFQLACRDPHVDMRWVAVAVPGTAGSLSVERRQYSTDERGVPVLEPVSRKTVGTLALPAGMRIVAKLETVCAP